MAVKKIQRLTHIPLNRPVQMLPLSIFHFLFSYSSPVGVNEMLRDLRRRFCSIVRFGVPVPFDIIPLLVSAYHLTDHLVGNVRIFLRSVSIKGFLRGRRRRISLRDCTISVASTALGQTRSVNQDCLPKLC